MPIIQHAAVYLVELPIVRPHQLSMHTITKQSVVFVKLTDEDGETGWGEAATIGGASYEEMTPEAIKVNLEHYFLPFLLYQDPSAYGELMQTLQKNIKGNRFAKGAVESALLDLYGKQLQLPVYQLLGGKKHDRLRVAWTLASGDTGKDIEEAKELLHQRRHNIFKLKIGSGDPRQNIQHVLSIKKALGDEVRITVDVNQAWDEQTANECLPFLQDGGVAMVEQPLPDWNEDGMKRLTQKFSLSIMADESARSIQDVFRVAKNHSADSISLKIPKHGGLTETKKAAAIAESAGLQLYGGTMIDTALGTAAAAHVYATLPAFAFDTELFGPLLYQDQISFNAIQYENHQLIIPKGPGLGIELDEDKINHYSKNIHL